LGLRTYYTTELSIYQVFVAFLENLQIRPFQFSLKNAIIMRLKLSMANFLKEKLKSLNPQMVLIALLSAVLVARFQIIGAEAAFLPLPGVDDVDIAKPVGDTAIQRAESFLGPLARVVRIIIGAVAVLLIVVSGFTMVIGGENEETVKNQRKSLTYGILGLMMISIAGPLAEIFDYRQGNLLEDSDAFLSRTALFTDTTQMIITFVRYLLGALASLMMIRAGGVMVVQGSSEEIVTREKKSFALAAGGLFMVFISSLVVNQVVFVTSYSETLEETIVSIDSNEFARQLIGFTNLLISFVGPIMILTTVIGGLLYITAGGNDERTDLAKKMMKNSVIGIVIIYGAFSLVSTLITGVF
jgi:hypothetical protein